MSSISISNKPSDFVIAGAGIVGLATAMELKKRFPSCRITILEKEPKPGLHASGRNSGVLHSGIYYSKGTLKATVCSEGARRMKSFARQHQIPCYEWGKVIVGTKEEDVAALDKLMRNAQDNGIRAERLNEAGIKMIEPNAHAPVGGIVCPDTAVIDAKAVVKKCFELLRDQNVEFVFERRVTGAVIGEKKLLTQQGEKYSYGKFINCAGAYADVIAKIFGLGRQYAFVPFKGIYFKLRAEKNGLVKSSIYPVPNLLLPFLGVHFTRVVGGDVYVGPTAIPALGRENYGLLSGIKMGEMAPILSRLLSLYAGGRNNFRLLVHLELRKYLKSGFLKAAQQLVPSVTSADLMACDKVGIRPQLVNIEKNKLEMDYLFEKSDDSLHVLNAISPAFTSAFRFAEVIVDQLAL